MQARVAQWYIVLARVFLALPVLGSIPSLAHFPSVLNNVFYY